MRILLDKLTILAGCFLFLLYTYPNPGMLHVTALLLSFSFLCLCTYCNPDMAAFDTLPPFTRYLALALCAAFLFAGLALPAFTPFLPLLLYELIQNKFRQFAVTLPVILYASRSHDNFFFCCFFCCFF